MGSTVNISVTTYCKHLCKYPVVYLDGKARVEINKRKYKKKREQPTFLTTLPELQSHAIYHMMA